MSAPLAAIPRPWSQILAVIAGFGGGALFNAMSLPAGWMSGSILTVGVLAFLGLDCILPELVRQVMFLSLGTQIGASVTPDTIHMISRWPIAFAGVVIAVVVIVLTAAQFLQRVEGFSRGTAFFSSIPGALSTVLALSAREGVDMQSVVVTQSMRLVVLIGILPLAMYAFGIMPHGGQIPAPPIASPADYALLLGCACIGAFLFERLHIAGGLILGAMAASAMLHGMGATTVRLPLPVTVIALVLMGVLIAARLRGLALHQIKRLFRASMGSLALQVTVATLFAALFAPLAGLPFAKALLAFSPGAFEAMVILSFVLDLDPAFVGTMHLARVLMLSALLPFAARLYLGGVQDRR